MDKQCPFLEKYYIPFAGDLEDWQKRACTDSCPLQDQCILNIEGRISSVIIEKLKNANLPCPRCQGDPVFRREVRAGERISSLYKNEDGDWACLFCNFMIYQHPFRKKVRTGKRGRKKRRRCS